MVAIKKSSYASQAAMYIFIAISNIIIIFVFLVVIFLGIYFLRQNCLQRNSGGCPIYSTEIKANRDFSSD
jgi:hypothetical protein